VDIRIIAATNRNLEELAAQGHFRKDLFFRLAVTTLHLPPLRERKEDLLALVAHYLCYYNQRFGRAVRALSEEAMDLLLAYDWPGNVRELKNVLEAVFVELPANDDIEVAELPARFRSRYAESKHVSADERARLLWALSATNWNKSRAALKLHWSRMTLYRKMARYNIQVR
jgi:transcriptional regulator with PAS, ATPase and Fis domain